MGNKKIIPNRLLTMETTGTRETRNYSPFWAVWIALWVLVIVFGMQTFNLFQQRNQLNLSVQKSGGDWARAMKINQTMLAVGNDLDQLGKDSSVARKILEECKIQISNRSSANTPTPSPAGAVSANPPTAQSPADPKKK